MAGVSIPRLNFMVMVWLAKLALKLRQTAIGSTSDLATRLFGEPKRTVRLVRDPAGGDGHRVLRDRTPSGKPRLRLNDKTEFEIHVLG